jgi:hypothetical protein
VGLLALWVGRGTESLPARWLALVGGIAIWSIVLEFLHPQVAQAADSRGIFVLQASVILAVLTGLRFLPRRSDALDAGKSRQLTLKRLMAIVAILGLALATSNFQQPNRYSSLVTWQISFWRVAVGATCAVLALSAWWASQLPWRRAPAALAFWAAAGMGLAFAFANFETLWPPAHNPGEAHYPSVFRAFCLSYTTWAVVQGGFVFIVLVAAKACSAAGTFSQSLPPPAHP